MIKQLTILIVSIVFPVLVFGQKYMIRGVVSDANSNETLIGATVSYGEGKGVITDMDGRYFLKLEPGSYHLKISYVGYIMQEVDVVVKEAELVMDFQLKTPTLTEVEVVADIAKTRETPVAFSTVQPIKLQEELASRDIPMILNKTPGVYATQQGGGDGDARINIRGFSQRNLAVMIDGIPVNDMENGWVYWSNWFGLDAVTRNIQVQRGLGASKLALPSVGGTMNIITRGIDANMSAGIKQEFGSNGYFRTSFGVTTGMLKHGWGVTVAGSYKQGNGWADNTWTKGWFGYMRVDKKLGHHTLTLTAMGAPQKHAQRSYKKSIATFDKDYAAKLDIDTSKTGPSYGLRYNSNWGHLNRWNWGPDGPDGEPTRTDTETVEDLSQSLNYYSKPQFSLRDFWAVNDKFYWSNILYASIGNGGGTGNFSSNAAGGYITSTFNINESDGLVNYQSYYDRNMNDPTHRSEGILRSSVNNHRWYGLLSTFSWEINSEFTFSGGLDLRTYKGEHYGEVYDLLGGDFMRDDADKNKYKYQNMHVGDKIYYNNDALVRWGGIFGQLEYKKGNWSAFLNLTTAVSAYKRVDYFKKMDVVTDGTTFTEVVGYGQIFYYDGTTSITYDSTRNDKQYSSNDTLYVIHAGDTTSLVNPAAYTITSPDAEYTQTGWKVLPGWTIKGGANYNINKRNNIFMNLGYLSKAPRFSNVYNNDNKEFLDIKNEIIKAIEVGYSFNTNQISVNVNGYLTRWNNRPLDRALSVTIDGDSYPVNINGIDALHTGIEIEFGWKPIPSLQWDQVLSLGDWRWTSGGTAYIYDPAGNLKDSLQYNAKGVHVGDAAQFQFMESLRWEIIKYLYVSGSATVFAKNFSQMDPTSLTPTFMDENGDPRDSWQLPVYCLVDFNAGYRFIFKKFKLDLRGSVLNLLNSTYISDAQNNDSYAVSPNPNGFDATSAGVFFGQGTTFNASIAISY